MKMKYVKVVEEYIPEEIYNLNPEAWESVVSSDFNSGIIALEMKGGNLVTIDSLGCLDSLEEKISISPVIGFYFLPSSVRKQVDIQKVAKLLDSDRIVISNLPDSLKDAGKVMGIKKLEQFAL